MQKTQSKRRAWIWLIALLILFIIISYFTLSQKPKHYPNYVSDSPSPTGVKALFTYLEDEKEVKRWSHSPGLLPSGAGNHLLVMVEPYFTPETEEMEAYMDFMEAGNTILLFQRNPKGMFDLEITPIVADFPLGEESRINDKAGAVYKAELNSPIRLQTSNQDDILLEDEAGTIALKRSFGKGQLIVSNSPEWILNGKLLNENHLPLVLSLINEGDAPVFLFDEYTHGGQNASTIITLYPKWFLLLMLQGIILSILFLWYGGKRFGPLFIPREETVRFSDEGIQALSAWYLRGRRYHDSLIIQADYVKLLLQERWGIPYSKEWKDLTDHLERKRTKMPTSEIRSFLNDLMNVLEKEKVSKREYLHWSKRLDRLREEVEE